MTGTSLALVVIGSIASVAVLQELPVPQQWTIIGILGFVLAGNVWLLQSVGSRLVTAVDKLSTTNADLVLQLQKLAIQNEAFQEQTTKKHEEYARERDRAVDEVKKAIEDIRGRGR